MMTIRQSLLSGNSLPPYNESKEGARGPIVWVCGAHRGYSSIKVLLVTGGKGSSSRPLMGAVLDQMTGPELAGDLPGMVSEIFHESWSTKFYFPPNEA